ncbi:MAG: YraN family protein [Candidatus Eremiobacteraeota bacterium]|nr:YraN family protein [Candidatus Eremiobacteraeota bacterium]
MRSKPLPNSGKKGAQGENRASGFLKANGYRVLARNVRLPGGEIDAVCLDGPTLVFVEVKRRDSRTFGSAIAAVDARKRAILRAIAADYAQIVAPSSPIRFDVVALDGDRINLHRDAF